MRNIALLWMFLLCLALPVRSQITITNAVFPAVGDTLFYALDNQPGEIIMTPPGGNQQWDFSGLRPSLPWQQVFEHPGAGANQAAFPGATLLNKSANGSVETYVRVSNGDVSLLGYFGADPVGLGVNLATTFNPPIVQSRAPVQFFDINQISSGLLLPISANQLPAAIVNQLPVRPDSIRIRIAINRLDVVDGWGRLSVPGGTFDVLREKRTEYRETRLDAKVPPLGWLDITDVAIQTLNLTALGVDTTVTYHFLSNQAKEPIAICTTDNSQLRVVAVQFKNIDRTTGVDDLAAAGAGLRVFPNPAGDVVRIRASGMPAGSYALVISNVLGMEVWRKTYRQGADLLEEEVDIARFEKGVYVCRFSNGRALLGQARFVKQ